jgi:hypothetical protein
LSLTLAAILIGAGALFGGGTWAWRRRRPPAKPSAATATAPVKVSLLSTRGFDIELGDVIEVGGRELWLEHGWVLAEGEDPIVALFSAREATLVALPAPSRALYLLDEVDLKLPGDPPLTLESNGVRFERVRRLPIRVEVLEKSPPLPWEEALLSEYRGLATDALFVLGQTGRLRAWQGRQVGESEIERWGGGKSTLE